MNKLTLLTSALLITLSAGASAGHWEKMSEHNSVTTLSQSGVTANPMGLTAVEYKRWVFDDVKYTEQDADITHNVQLAPKASNTTLTAVQSKRQIFDNEGKI